MNSPQVSENHYKDNLYETPERFISYFNQQKTILDLVKKLNKPSKILEIGKGTGILSWYLKNRGLEVKTFDLADDLSPDYVGDVREISKIISESFDIICAFEILEHIPYKDLDNVFQQFHDLSREYVVISVPQARLYFSFWFKLTKLIPFSAYISLPFPVKHNFDGQHYWELGKAGFSKNSFKNKLKIFFDIESEFVSPLNPYHRIFVLKK
jgi:SAM-dependent methyltransferase